MLPEFYTTQAFGTQRRLCWRMRNDYFTLNITSSFLYHHIALLVGQFPKFLTPHWLHLFSRVIYLAASPFSNNNETGGKDEFFSHPKAQTVAGEAGAALTLSGRSWPPRLFSCQCKHPKVSPMCLLLSGFALTWGLPQQGCFCAADRHILWTPKELYVLSEVEVLLVSVFV